MASLHFSERNFACESCLSNLPSNHEEISSRLLRSIKKKSASVIESIEGYQMTDGQKYRMRLVHTHMDYITSTISDIDSMINSLVKPYENAVQLLCTIPGAEYA